MKKQHRSLLSILILYAFLLGGCTQNVVGSPGDISEREPAGSTIESDITEDSPAGTSTPQETSTETTPAPQVEFEGIDLDGNTVTDEFFSGSRLTMVNVWATYCDPCLREMPGLCELAAEYDPAEFQIIGIVSDVLEGDDQSLAEELVQQTGAAYPHLLLNQSVYMAFLTDVTGVPTTYFVNENGEILGSVLGSMQKSSWEELIHALLEQ